MPVRLGALGISERIRRLGGDAESDGVIRHHGQSGSRVIQGRRGVGGQERGRETCARFRVLWTLPNGRAQLLE